MALMGEKYIKTITQLITPRQNIKIAAALARAIGYKTIVESPSKEIQYLSAKLYIILYAKRKKSIFADGSSKSLLSIFSFIWHKQGQLVA